MKWRKSNILLLFLPGFLLLSIWLFRLFLKKKITVQTMKKLIHKHIKDSQSKEFKSLTVEQKAHLSELLAAQAAHETGDFTSRIFSENNNAFGMKASTRNYESGERYGHAIYLSLGDSIKDMLEYLSDKIKPLKEIAEMSISEYAIYLKSVGYFEDTVQNYTSGLMSFYEGEKK
jgi:predicted hydrocarbon binding protein